MDIGVFFIFMAMIFLSMFSIVAVCGNENSDSAFNLCILFLVGSCVFAVLALFA